jgi:hypothetical protein
MASIRQIILLAALAAALILSGCIQPPQAQRCASAPAAEMDTCMWETAILYQEPYLCYSVKNAKTREACLDGSNNPAEAERLRNERLAGAKPALEPAQTPPADQAMKEEVARVQAEVQLPEPQRSIVACNKTGMSEEECMRKVATDTKNLSLCAAILEKNMRVSCISRIAATTKDMGKCNELSALEDKNVCKYYAGG